MTFLERLRILFGGGGTTSPAPTPPPPGSMPGVLYDQHYGPDWQQVVDVYPGKGPAVLVVHGGGWAGGENGERGIVTICQTLSTQGYCAFGVNYRLVTASRPGHPMQRDDVRAAIAWVKANGGQHGATTGPAFLIGGSAGAHLVALAGLDDDNVRGVVPFSGPMDFEMAKGTPVPPSVRGYLGQSLETAPQSLIEDASPRYQIHPGAPPFLNIAGEADPIVPVAQARAMQKSLTDAGVDSTLKVVPSAGHAFALWRGQSAAVLAWLRAH